VNCMRKIGYSSHGEISALGQIKTLEKERGNEWFNDSGLDLRKTKAVWVTHDPRKALEYVHPAEFSNYPHPRGKNPTNLPNSMWNEYKRQMRDPSKHVQRVALSGSKLVLSDEDEGYLHIWPVSKMRHLK
jgi:hypothetical protein